MFSAGRYARELAQSAGTKLEAGNVNQTVVSKQDRSIKLKLTTDQDADITSAPEMIADLPEGALLRANKRYDSNALREMVAIRNAGRTFRQNPKAKTQTASACTSTESATASIGSSTKSSTTDASLRASTKPPRASSPR